ncbi:helix-turn-helix domain-containing protein [Aureisphaera galaxeae]|uniref:helix-turn-helix domain-containing protein n=1 Tax=Aureisphaera galaxeae TaxID=1538023 RepID=UPI0023508138|nr:helix-turn-helix domain-containing protein [Aureisphaera galaxeae]MDC8006365.1 helix-turn-helix domain-containing protein [Aureisphaera galaxeae]
MLAKVIFLFTLFLLLYSTHSDAQQAYTPNTTKKFEALTGKSLYQLIINYSHRYPQDSIAINKELENLLEEIKDKEDISMQADWFYMKTWIPIMTIDLSLYEDHIEQYRKFVTQHAKVYPYRSRLKMLEAYHGFVAGTWPQSLSAFEESYLLAKQEQDKLVEIISETLIAYISTFSEKKEEGIKKLKSILYRLDNTIDYASEIEKDIPLLQTRIIDYICRIYMLRTYEADSEVEFDGVSEIDSIVKFSRRFGKMMQYIDEPLLFPRIYCTEAFTAVLLKDYEKAQKHIDSAKFYSKGMEYPFIYYRVQADIFYGQKKYQDGIVIMEDYIELVSKVTEDSWLADEIKFLAKSHKMVGDHEKSNYYYEWFVRSNGNLDKIMDSVSRSIREKEIADFKKELDALQSENDSKSNLLRNTSRIGIPLLILLLLALLRSQILKKKKERQFEALMDRMERPSKPEETLISTSTKVSSVKEETKNAILEALTGLETQHFFLDTDCSAYNTAKKINTNTSYLSKVINEHYQKNFNGYINDLRIDYAIAKLKEDKRFRSYSIQGIAEELGYKSADSFTKYFRKRTGLLPSYYIKKLNEQE